NFNSWSAPIIASRSTQASIVRAFFMATSNTCVRLSIIASPRSFDPDDGRQRANHGDRSRQRRRLVRGRQKTRNSGPQVAFMLHGAAGSEWRPLKLLEKIMQHTRHENGPIRGQKIKEKPMK